MQTPDNAGAPASPAFLLIASPKSGTTWMQLMLSAHPEAHCVELRPWGQAYHHFDADRYHVNTDHYAGFLATLMRLPDPQPQTDADELAHALHIAALEWASERTGKPRIGEKVTPYAGGSDLAIKQTLARSPLTPIVHLVRDPRDVFVSGFVHHARVHLPAEDAARNRVLRMLDEGHAPDDAIPRWIENWRDVESAVSRATERGATIHHVSYEHLVADTESTLTDVMRHIGLDDAPSTVSSCVEAASFESLSGRPRGVEDRASFFRKGEPGDWMNWLTSEQSDRILTEAAPYWPPVHTGAPT